MTRASRGGRMAGPRLALVVAIALGLAAGLVPSPLVGSVAAIGLVANPDTLSTRHDWLATVAAPGVLANDLNLLGSTTAVLDSGPTHGTLNLATTGGYTYSPAAGFVGQDTFKYHDCCLLGLPSNSTTVTITVTNAAPIAVNDSYTAVTGVTLSVAAPGVIGNDHDADGDGLSASIVSSSGNGSLSLSANGAFTFTSGGSFTGLRTFTYSVSDGIVSSAAATVSIQVSAPSPTPTPTPTPTPAPTPTPTPAPTPTATPILPIPTLPIPTPTLPIATPTLPIATPTLPIAIPTPTLPTPTLPIPTLQAGATPTPTPGASSPASSSAASGASPPTDPTPGSVDGGGSPSPSAPGPGTIGSTGGGPNRPDGAGLTVGGGDGAPFDLGSAGLGSFDSIDWAVPALALTVPGLLLMLAVLGQLSVGALWLPVVRRWLGSFGVGRRRRRRNDPTPHGVRP